MGIVLAHSFALRYGLERGGIHSGRPRGIAKKLEQITVELEQVVQHRLVRFWRGVLEQGGPVWAAQRGAGREFGGHQKLRIATTQRLQVAQGEQRGLRTPLGNAGRGVDFSLELADKIQGLVGLGHVIVVGAVVKPVGVRLERTQRLQIEAVLEDILIAVPPWLEVQLTKRIPGRSAVQVAGQVMNAVMDMGHGLGGGQL